MLYPQTAVLFTPSIVSLLGDANLPVDFGDGDTLVNVDLSFPKFVDELTELMNQEVEVVFEKVMLPEKVAATCDKCSHNMDKMFEIEPSVLMALGKFVDVG